MAPLSEPGRPSSAFALGLLCAVVLVGACPTQGGVNVWTSYGPEGGRVSALAVDPMTPRTLYAGTGAGVFKSTDGGGTWNAANTGQPLNKNLTVTSLAIDPTTPSTLYAAGSGGVFKSTNGGDTWNVALSDSRYVTTLAIDPITPSTLYAWERKCGLEGCGGILYTSTDGASFWRASPIAFPPIVALAIDPTSPTTLYAGSELGVSKSTDGGKTWSVFVPVLPTDDLSGVNALAIDPITPTTLYSGTGYPDFGTGRGVFKSTDGGGTWNGVSAGLPSVVVHALAIDPTAPTTLYAGTDGGAFRSTDGGGMWSALNTGLTNLDVRALALDPHTPSRLYAGTRGGGVFAIDQVSACVGDCDGTGTVVINELVLGVNIVLGRQPASACLAFANAQGLVDIAQLILGVNNAMNGCVADSACDDHNPCTVDHFVSGETCQHTLPVLPCTDGPAAAPMYVGVWTDDTAERHIFRDQDFAALRATWES